MISQSCQMTLRIDPWPSNREAIGDLIRSLVEWSGSNAWLDWVGERLEEELEAKNRDSAEEEGRARAGEETGVKRESYFFFKRGGSDSELVY